MAIFEIELEAFEAVVEGGVRRVTWLVENEGEWRVVSEHPSARAEARDAGRGTVWVKRVTISLPPGALLVRVESAPQRGALRDPLAYLFAPEQGRARQTRRSRFVVGPSGKLERVAPPSTRSEAAKK